MMRMMISAVLLLIFLKISISDWKMHRIPNQYLIWICILAVSFWFYNKGGELIKRRGRKVKMEEENPIDPIDPIELYYTGKV